MLTIYGANNRMCDGISRRNFIQIGALGMGGLTMPQLLQAEKDSIDTYLALHVKISELKKDTISDNESIINELKTKLVSSASVWAKKGKSGFITLEDSLCVLDIDGSIAQVMVAPKEKKNQAKWWWGKTKKAEWKKSQTWINKAYNLKEFQQKYLESNFRYKKGYFEEGKEIGNRNQFATFISMRYNNLYGKIGFMTLLIALGTFIFSPVIKKLMGDVH